MRGPFAARSAHDVACVRCAQCLCDYLLYHEHNPRKALELCAEATMKARRLSRLSCVWHWRMHIVFVSPAPRCSWCAQADFNDWWWKARLGKCYYQARLLRVARARYYTAS